MRQLIMFCVIPSFHSYSVQWEACSSSTPGIAQLGCCYLPLGAPNLVCCALCVEQAVVSCVCRIILEQILDSPCFQPWDLTVTLGLRWIKQQTWSKRLRNMGAIWPLEGKLKKTEVQVHMKDHRIFEKTVDLQVGRWLDNWQVLL